MGPVCPSLSGSASRCPAPLSLPSAPSASTVMGPQLRRRGSRFVSIEALGLHSRCTTKTKFVVSGRRRLREQYGSQTVDLYVWFLPAMGPSCVRGFSLRSCAELTPLTTRTLSAGLRQCYTSRTLTYAMADFFEQQLREAREAQAQRYAQQSTGRALPDADASRGTHERHQTAGAIADDEAFARRLQEGEGKKHFWILLEVV